MDLFDLQHTNTRQKTQDRTAIKVTAGTYSNPPQFDGKNPSWLGLDQGRQNRDPRQDRGRMTVSWIGES